MPKKAVVKFRERLAYLFEKSETLAANGVNKAQEEAMKVGALDGTRVAIPISRAIEEAGEEALRHGLASLDRAAGKSGRKRTQLAPELYAALDRFFENVADQGKVGGGWGGGERNKFLDTLNYVAKARLRNAVDQHVAGWNDPSLSWAQRHPAIYDVFKILLGFVLGVFSMAIKAKFFP